MSRYVAESITTDAGRFDHVGLCQLHTIPANVLQSAVIDSATYLLTISLPDTVESLYSTHYWDPTVYPVKKGAPNSEVVL